VSLVFKVPRHDWDAGMPCLWQAFGLAEAVEERLPGPRVVWPGRRACGQSGPDRRSAARALGRGREQPHHDPDS
jgi:hypothetical protein